MLDAELAYLFLIKGGLEQLQEVEDLLYKKATVDEIKKKNPISCVYTLWNVTQVVERFEEERLGKNNHNKASQLFSMTHIYAQSLETLGFDRVLLHNYTVGALQITDELIFDIREERYKFF